MPLIRATTLLATLLAAAPVYAQSGEGMQALAGLEEAAVQMCGHTAPKADPINFAAGIEGPIGGAMGLHNEDSIIGIIYRGDPHAAARMWASAGTPCDSLIQMLSRPATEIIEEIN